MRFLQLAVVSLFLLLALSSHAKSYKCTDREGNVEYSQFPCKADEDSREIHLGATSKFDPEACAAVQSFAADIVKRMRSGTAVEQEIATHGGLNGISKATLNIINYAYSFKVNESVSDVKISALAKIKCQNNAFGQVSYSDLPQEYDPEYQAKQTPVPAEAQQQTPSNKHKVEQSKLAPDCEKLMQEAMALGKDGESSDVLQKRAQLMQKAVNDCKQ